MGSITVRLDAFEGPFDLLFHLIEKNKIDIYDIPIAKLTEQYLDFLEQAEERDMDEMSRFLVMAATLLEIKSRMLLPRKKMQQEEDYADPREELVEKLLEYRKFKEISKSFKEREDIWAKRLFKETDVPLIVTAKEPMEPTAFLQGLTMEDIYRTFEEVMKKRRLKTDTVQNSFQRVEKDRFTIQEQMEYIRDVLKMSPQTTFEAIFRKGAAKMEVVVTFLALLEMMRQREVILIQKHNFDAILIQRVS